jgi:ribonuclease III
MQDDDDLETLLDYRFQNPKLLQEALTHPSLSYETQQTQADNQRLEFLGDAVLQLMVTNALFLRHPQSPEGPLTKLRSSLVSRSAIAGYARKLKLGERLTMGKGEESSGGRARPSSLADAFEAVIGAIFLDGGYTKVVDVLNHLLATVLDAVHLESVEFNPKGQLQEVLQSSRPEAPRYKIIGEEGPDHSKIFISQVSWQKQVLGEGRGPSKKQAESSAARAALENPVVLDLLPGGEKI